MPTWCVAIFGHFNNYSNALQIVVTRPTVAEWRYIHHTNTSKRTPCLSAPNEFWVVWKFSYLISYLSVLQFRWSFSATVKIQYLMALLMSCSCTFLVFFLYVSEWIHEFFSFSEVKHLSEFGRDDKVAEWISKRAVICFFNRDTFVLKLITIIYPFEQKTTDIWISCAASVFIYWPMETLALNLNVSQWMENLSAWNSVCLIYATTVLLLRKNKAIKPQRNKCNFINYTRHIQLLEKLAN